MKLLSLLLVTAGLFVRVPGEEENGEKEDVGTVVGIDLGTTYSWYSEAIGSFCIVHYIEYMWDV